MQKIWVIFMGILLSACTATKEDVRNKSLNFNRGVFTNINPVKMHSFWNILWTGITTDMERADWPEWVETKADKSPVGRVHDGKTRITFINHATFLIQVGGFNILTDPVFSKRASPVSFAGPKRVHKPGVSLDDLPKIDVIIISHDHYDHLDLSSIKKLTKRDNPKIYVGLGVGSRLATSENIHELDWLESADVAEGFTLWFLDVQHFSGRSLADRNTTLWGGFLLNVGGKKIYFGGDSGYADHYKRTYERFGPIDIAFLPIGAYAPKRLFKTVHLDPFEAVQAHIDLKATISIGMHHGTFQISAESRIEPQILLEQAKRKANIAPFAFITLDVGKPLDLQEATLANRQRQTGGLNH